MSECPHIDESLYCTIHRKPKTKCLLLSASVPLHLYRHCHLFWRALAEELGRVLTGTCESLVTAYTDAGKAGDEYRRGQSDTAYHLLHTWETSKVLAKLAAARKEGDRG